MAKGQKQSEYGRESLSRATSGHSIRNDVAVIQAFAERGIAANPRIDVFTFNAWRALNRHVRKGEKSVHVPTIIYVPEKTDDTGKKTKGYARKKTACLFHVSQTDPDDGHRPDDWKAGVAALYGGELPDTASAEELLAAAEELEKSPIGF